MTMTIQLPVEVENLSLSTRERLTQQVNSYVTHVIREILEQEPDSEAIVAIRSALQEDASEEMSLEEFAKTCGIRL